MAVSAMSYETASVRIDGRTDVRKTSGPRFGSCPLLQVHEPPTANRHHNNGHPRYLPWMMLSHAVDAARHGVPRVPIILTLATTLVIRRTFDV
jgi:hypothetical protein